LPSIQEQDMWFGVFYVVQYVTFTFEYQRTFYLSIGSCFSGPNGWGFPWNQKTTRFSDKCNSGRRNFFCVHWIKGYSC
jgi:hypothetical protein